MALTNKTSSYLSRILPFLVVVPLIIGAADDPPTPEEPPKVERSFTIRGASLTIQPGSETTYLSFGGGIVCTANDMRLSADMLELDVNSGSLSTQGELKFPNVPTSLERTVDDPGEVARAMAAELELPKAHFSEGAIARVGAKGNVQVDFLGISLSTDELVSTDGGSSWAARGRTTVVNTNTKLGYQFSLSADYLLFDVVHSNALIRGNISGELIGEGLEPLKLTAQRLEFNQLTGFVKASEQLQLSYGSIELRCGFSETAGEPENNLTDPAAVGAISLNIKTQVVVASGGVVLSEHHDGLTLEAEEIEASIQERWAIASGKPLLTKGESSFSGEVIKASDLGGKVVVEVVGPQSAVLNPDDANADTDETSEGEGS